MITTINSLLTVLNKRFSFKKQFNHRLLSRINGFTLIELIVVIIIIAILAAIAIPRFTNQTSSARIASLNGLAGGIAGTLVNAKSEYLTEVSAGVTGASAGNITMENQAVTVSVASGTAGVPTPTSGGIGSAARISGFTGTAAGSGSTATYTYNFSGTNPPSNCFLTYNADGSTTITSSGC